MMQSPSFGAYDTWIMMTANCPVADDSLGLGLLKFILWIGWGIWRNLRHIGFIDRRTPLSEERGRQIA